MDLTGLEPVEVVAKAWWSRIDWQGKVRMLRWKKWGGLSDYRDLVMIAGIG